MKKYLPILFVVILIILPFVFSPVKGVFLYISRPLLNLGEKGTFGFSRFFETIKTVKFLTEENDRLREENQKLQAEKMVLLEEQKENEILKRQLGFIESNKQKFIVAAIIGRSPTAFVQYLILNKGKQDGIVEGQVVESEGFLVGKVKEVYPTTSTVFLITNPTSAVAAISAENRSQGLVRGEIGYGLSLGEVPKEALLKEGESILTSGLGGDFPKGIPIGTVEKINSNPSDLFQKVSLKPPLDFFKLEYVLVIKNENG